MGPSWPDRWPDPRTEGEEVVDETSKIRFCCDCKYSGVERSTLCCYHPKVNVYNVLYLVSPYKTGAEICEVERYKTTWYSKCGLKGKLWEKK